MALPVNKPKALLADKGYDGDAVREALLLQGILPVIPPKANRKVHIPCDFSRYRDRNRIERMFGYLKHMRRIGTRYEKTALSFASFLNLAAIRRWLKDFVNRTYAFPSRIDPAENLSTRQYARLIDEWVTAIGLRREDYGTHSLRRTKAAMIYKATGNLRAIQILLGHTKIENTVRYLGVDIEDASELAEHTEI